MPFRSPLLRPGSVPASPLQTRSPMRPSSSPALYSRTVAASASSADMPSTSGSQPAPEGSKGKAASLQEKLGSYGIAGVASYGFLNTVYYLCTFTFIWLYVAQVPKGLGLAEAARKFIEVMAITWAGSQVTKLIRAGGALAMAPLVDRMLDLIAKKLNLRGKGQAFAVVVILCLSLALTVFAVTVLAWS